MKSLPSLKELADLVGLQLGAEEVRPDDHLQSDLGAESADLLNLVLAIEDTWDLSISDDNLARIKTVRDLHSVISAPGE